MSKSGTGLPHLQCLHESGLGHPLSPTMVRWNGDHHGLEEPKSMWRAEKVKRQSELRDQARVSHSDYHPREKA